MIRNNTYVYFIQAGEAGKIKIGYSKYPLHRLQQLMDWSPEKLHLVAFAPGGQDEEQRIHALLRKHYSHKEWFHPTTEVISLMKWVASTAQIPRHILPERAPYRENPHRKQVSKWTPEQRANMSRVQLAVWARKKAQAKAA